jgi:hypothetical protein
VDDLANVGNPKIHAGDDVFKPRHRPEVLRRTFQTRSNPFLLPGLRLYRSHASIEVEIDAWKTRWRYRIHGLIDVLFDEPGLDESVHGSNQLGIARNSRHFWKLVGRANIKCGLPFGLPVGLDHVGYDSPEPFFLEPQKAEREAPPFRKIHLERGREVIEVFERCISADWPRQRPWANHRSAGALECSSELVRHTVEDELRVMLLTHDLDSRSLKSHTGQDFFEAIHLAQLIAGPLHTLHHHIACHPVVEALDVTAVERKAFVSTIGDIGRRYDRVRFDEPRSKKVVDRHVDPFVPASGSVRNLVIRGALAFVHVLVS